MRKAVGAIVAAGVGYFINATRSNFQKKLASEIIQIEFARAALVESEERFRSAFNEAGIGMTINSLDGQIRAANAAFCQFIGYSEEELMEKTVFEFISPPCKVHRVHR